jgi:outer membrane protein assembly factor BamB
MGRGVTRVTLGLALLVLAGAGTARAQGGFLRVEVTPPGDRVVEGDSGTIAVTVTFYLTSANPFGPTTVNWTTTPGSALDTEDFVTAGGTVTFPQFDNTQKTGTVLVQNDMFNEWSSSLQQDEFFFVDLSTPVGAAGIEKGRATVTIVDNDAPQPGVQFLSAVTDSTGPLANQARNRLQFRVPAGQPNPPTQVTIAWTSGLSSCTPPTNDTEGQAPGPAVINLLPADAGTKKMWSHNVDTPPNFPVQVGMVYCYAVFTKYPALSGQRAEVVVKTFDSTTGPVKWTYTPGYYFGSPALSVVPPTVGADGIYTVTTDGVVHAMGRSDTGGLWPLNWQPVALGRPAHNRSPVVPLAAGSRLFVGTESGEVHAVDGRTGALVWSRSQRFNNTALMPGLATGVQATPAGLFKDWGGQNDLILVGTSTSANTPSFFALDPATGSMIDYYPYGPVGPADSPPGPIRNVAGMAVADYAGNRVYFGAAGGGSEFTLWSLDLGPMGSPNLTRSATAWNPKPLSAGTNGSPVLRGGRLYVGTIDGKAHSFRLADGALSDLDLSDGEPKGFMFPDRRNGNLYFSTNGKVWGVRDDLEPASPNLNVLWFIDDIPNPSIVLQRPGTDELYVGGGDGRLYKIDVASADPEGTKTSVLLETGASIFAPSLDIGHDLILVGSSTGVIHAVRP